MRIVEINGKKTRWAIANPLCRMTQTERTQTPMDSEVVQLTGMVAGVDLKTSLYLMTRT
jgi:hypothetical protein